MNAKTMIAVLTTGDGRTELGRIAVPRPGPKQVLIKVVVAAQNPTDWKTTMNFKQWGNVVGCDFAGIVVELGQEVDEEFIQPGHRVASFVHGAVDLNGSFAEYLVSPAHLLIKIPDHLSFENAAQVPIASLTACQCLFKSLSLPVPLEKTDQHTDSTTIGDILIWGGNTSVGRIAIQLAKMSGVKRIVSTSSPENFEALKKLGVTQVFDYRDHKAGQKINSYTGGKLRIAMDCIGEGTTPFQVSEALSAGGGTISVLNPYLSRKNGVETIHSLGYTLLGQAFEFPCVYEPRSGELEFGTKMTRMVSGLLVEKRLRLSPVRIIPRGLAGVVEGFDIMKRGKANHEKIVYRIADTPPVTSGPDLYF
ncbi:GroES-like protein [Dendrothele bispora CBS 962.96]|uniref:GroES-like protein n=1 Tax=Dendrothele bispora (strain CBS 962.96) TaxID=1314807 RepID=A0A4S8L424_DENBC|nr:GroES-like protein [Dendrothele bispora CBS 962.96]